MVVPALLAAAALAAGAAPAGPAPAGQPVADAPAAGAQAAPPPRKLEFPVAPGLPEEPVMNPHDYRGAPYCAWCHEGRDPAAKGDPVALCAQCHPPSIMKHPYGRPAKQLPAALPLGEGGRIVCHTCHDPHDVKAHRKGLRLDYQPLCDQCHAGHVKQAQPAPAPSPRVKPAPAPVQPGKPAAGRPATPAR